MLGHGVAVIAEEHVGFDRELAVLVARSPHGQVAAYPVVETVQRDGICRRGARARARAGRRAGASRPSSSRCGLAARARGDRPARGGAVRDGRRAAAGQRAGDAAAQQRALDHRGGPRRRSSSSTCGPCSTCRWATPALVAPRGRDGQCARRRRPGRATSGYTHVMAADPGVKVHLYGKQVRPGRKIGHVTVVGRRPGGPAAASGPGGPRATWRRGRRTERMSERPLWSASSWAATRTGR